MEAKLQLDTTVGIFSEVLEDKNFSVLIDLCNANVQRSSMLMLFRFKFKMPLLSLFSQ